MFVGCDNSENIDMKNDASALTEEQLTELLIQYDCGEEQWQSPIFAEDYTPAESEESVLYQKLPYDETIPYEELEVRAFGNGKVVYSYMTEKFGQNGGGEDYDAGHAVIYDIETGKFVAGDIFPREIMWSGERLFTEEACYYINMSPNDVRYTALTRLDLNTGKIEAAVEYPDNAWLGYFAKLDENRFTVEIPGRDSLDFYDFSNNSNTQLINIPVTGTLGVYCWNDNILHFYGVIREVILEQGRFVDGPIVSKKSFPHVSRIDPDTGNEKAYEIVQEIDIHPGTDITDLLRGQDYSFHSSYDATFWIVYGEDAVRKIRLSENFYGAENETGMAQNTGISYHWDSENILYSIDVSTGKMQYLDFGHREKKMWFFNDENGNVLISVENGRNADAELTGVYYIPASTIRSQSKPYLAGN